MLEKSRGKISTLRGDPTPLGITKKENGFNFALFSEHATAVTLAFFEENKSEPSMEMPLDPSQNKTGSIWHIFLENPSLPPFYAYRIEGPQAPEHRFDPHQWVLDPYAKEINTSSKWGEEKLIPLGKVYPQLEFEWEGDAPLNLPWENLILYEMHVRGFTKDKSSQVKNPGTFLGLIEKIPYLKDLGINAIELLPIFEFEETNNLFHNPKTKEKLFNYWGYSPLHFFSPMGRYATQKNSTLFEFKTMVKELHKAGIEVLLDVVFNHTQNGSYFRCLDNSVYYLLDEKGQDTNYTGCGNTIQCNHPQVIEFILSCLKYWVLEMHVDGFRFDLASIFCRDEKGNVLENPPIIQAINNDPILANTKLIAEPWDCAGLYQVGSFPGNNRWAEWNAKFRDTTRLFLKGTEGQVEPFASVLSASEGLYNWGRPASLSINFITAHDGFTLRDLVSYNEKHNEDNGEENRDGNSCNLSWNCGEEGTSENADVLHLRKRQMKNFLLALGVAIGTPMFLMGDEYGHTRQGNNNAYCQDNEKNYFLWDHLEKNRDLFRFFQKILQFRKQTLHLQRKDFFRREDVTWHGHLPHSPNWNHQSRFIAYTLKDHQNHSDLYIAFNAHYEWGHIHLPEPPKGKNWKRLVDTSLSPPHDFSDSLEKIDSEYHLCSYSALLLKCE